MISAASSVASARPSWHRMRNITSMARSPRISFNTSGGTCGKRVRRSRMACLAFRRQAVYGFSDGKEGGGGVHGLRGLRCRLGGLELTQAGECLGHVGVTLAVTDAGAVWFVPSRECLMERKPKNACDAQFDELGSTFPLKHLPNARRRYTAFLRNRRLRRPCGTQQEAQFVRGNCRRFHFISQPSYEVCEKKYKRLDWMSTGGAA